MPTAHVVIRTRASSVSKHRMVIELPLCVFRLISDDESPTTNFPDIPGYHVCNTTETVMYMLFVWPHSIAFHMPIRLYIVWLFLDRTEIRTKHQNPH